MTENDLARIVVDLCIRLHIKYGPGLLESVYEDILVYELIKAGFNVKRQVSIPLVHEEVKIRVAFRADLVVEDVLLLELKSVDALSKEYYKKVLTYLKLMNLKLGLLINFNVVLMKDGIHRIVNKL